MGRESPTVVSIPIGEGIKTVTVHFNTPLRYNKKQLLELE